MFSLSGRGAGFKSGDSSGGREEGQIERMNISEEEKAGVGRQRGVFAFALAGDSILTHSPFYSAATDPWTMRLEHTPALSEPAK